MIDPGIARALVREVERLSPAEQRQVLDFARALGKQSLSGPTGKAILELVGVFDADDLAEMAAAIEESCERVENWRPM